MKQNARPDPYHDDSHTSDDGQRPVSPFECDRVSGDRREKGERDRVAIGQLA
jgi:hypothetical protein